MKSRFLSCAGALALAGLAPAAAVAQGVVIDHEEVECIVAGKYPKMNACFSPVSLAKRPRVYFRPETLSTWYYVEMVSDAPCYSVALLRPSKELVGKQMFYYVDVAGGGSRTAEYGPTVVASEEECRDKVMAPLSRTGPAAVLPNPPTFGFITGGGLSSTTVVGGVAAAALVTGGAVLLTKDDDNPQTTTPATVPSTNPPVTTPPVTTPDPGSRPNPLVVACQATPRSGDAPLRVAFATFPSGGTGSYEFLWTFGDGGSATNPNPAHTFLFPGVFNSTVRVISGDQTATCSRPITVTTTPGPGPSPSPSPSPTTVVLNVSLAGTGAGTVTGPGINCPGDCTETYLSGTVVNLTATPAAGPAPSGFKQWTGNCTGTANPCVLTMSANKSVTAHFELIRTLSFTGGANSGVPGSISSSPPGLTCSWTGAPPPTPCTDTAPFLHGTTVTLTLVTGGSTIVWGGVCTGTVGTVCTVLMDADKLVTLDTRFQFDPKSTMLLKASSELDVADGEGQVVTNGLAASAVRAGLAAMTTEARPGMNRVEAVLVRGGGRPGTWRFDFSGQPAFKAGSLRVIAGTVVLVTGDAVVFRLQGRPGERVVFTFEVEP